MWTLKEEALGKTKVEIAEIFKEKLEGLKSEIKEIVDIEVGINICDSDQAFDVVLYSTFKNSDDLAIYQKHPKHVEVGEFVAQVKVDRRVVDYIQN